MKYYKPGSSPNDPFSPDWEGITSTANQVYLPSGYMIFVRGDRSIPGPFNPAIPTNLRTKGTLFTYTQKVPVGVYVFGSVGNLYASAIDMTKLMPEREGGVDEFFTVWNSTLGGLYGYGAYQTYGLNPATGHYESTPGGVQNDDIESGQAFFVQTTSGGGNVVFNEHSKATTNSMAVFTPVGISAMPAQLRTNLYRVNSDGSTLLADGTLTQYNDDYSNNIDGKDARKIYNPTENFFIRSGGKDLIIERRKPILQSDTIFYEFKNESLTQYRLEIIGQNLSSNVAEGYLIDKYLNTKTSLNMDGVTQYNFSIENNSGSKDTGRFYIIFKPVIIVPATITSLKAYPDKDKVNVVWDVINEKNVKQYEVERSLDGISFTKQATLNALNTGVANYTWLDKDLLPGYYYYRIRCINKDGKIQYTTVVKVLIGDGRPSITIYPNPIINGIINLHLNNLPAGRYGIRLMNQLGQIIIKKQIERMAGSSIENIQWNYNLAHGIYRLEVTQPDGSMKEIKVLY